jgi:hypothetical protein
LGRKGGVGAERSGGNGGSVKPEMREDEAGNVNGNVYVMGGTDILIRSRRPPSSLLPHATTCLPRLPVSFVLLALERIHLSSSCGAPAVTSVLVRPCPPAVCLLALARRPSVRSSLPAGRLSARLVAGRLSARPCPPAVCLLALARRPSVRSPCPPAVCPLAATRSPAGSAPLQKQGEFL